MLQLLITRPRHDTPTHYLFHWAGLIKDDAESRGVRVIDLVRHKARKDKFSSYLSRQSIDIVIVNGHGNQDSVGGHDNEILLSVADGPELIKGKNIFIRACDAGFLLGPEIMKKGAKGFIGYIQPFIFPIDLDSFKTPLEDKLAGPILECSNQVALSLIKGKSIKEAQEDSKRKYVEKIDELSGSQSASSYLLPFLLWNMNNQVCL